MKHKTIFFSSLLRNNAAAEQLFDTLRGHNIPYGFIKNTNDIWLRDFMPVKTKSGKYVSFRYEPDYLNGCPELRTDYKQKRSKLIILPNVVYSDIKLDGGNIVFSPSREKAMISDRVFSENSIYDKSTFVQKLSEALEAEIIIIPSLKSDMTGHADGMVRFINENTVVGNKTNTKYGLEQKIKTALAKYDIEVVDFPYFASSGISAVGCYINFLELDKQILVPVFHNILDGKATSEAERIFKKQIVPVYISEIAKNGGGLNCISWEQ